MTYRAETCVTTQTEMKQAQKNMDNVIKWIIRAPSEIIIAEIGIWNIETQMAKKQITYYHKIQTSSDQGSQLYKKTMDKTNPWGKQVEKTLQTTNECSLQWKTTGENPSTSKEIHNQQTKEMHQITKI